MAPLNSVSKKSRAPFSILKVNSLQGEKAAGMSSVNTRHGSGFFPSSLFRFSRDHRRPVKTQNPEDSCSKCIQPLLACLGLVC